MMPDLPNMPPSPYAALYDLEKRRSARHKSDQSPFSRSHARIERRFFSALSSEGVFFSFRIDTRGNKMNERLSHVCHGNLYR